MAEKANEVRRGWMWPNFRDGIRRLLVIGVIATAPLVVIANDGQHEQGQLHMRMVTAEHWIVRV